MAVTLHDLKSASGLKKLDDYLLTRSYITGYVGRFALVLLFFYFGSSCFLSLICLFRYQASKDDVTVYAALSKAPSAEHVNVSRWYKHISALLRIS